MTILSVLYYLIYIQILYKLKMKLFFIQISILLLFLFGIAVNGQQCTPLNKQFLVTFHPHLDAFWLDFDDDLKNINWRPAGFLYSMNQRNSKQILNSMKTSLSANQSRKYFVTEVVFFKDWYLYLSQSDRDIVKKLIRDGQLEIANGGWVENDEAVCYYDDILLQYTVGHNYLYEQFGYITKIGWATDSFGHSHSQASLESFLGIQFQGIQRVDDRYINQRKGGPLLQFFWDAISDSNNQSYPSVMTHVRHFLHEVNNLRQGTYSNLQSDFKRIQTHMLDFYQKPKLFRFLGNDFQQFVTEEFTFLEKTFQELNKDMICRQYKYGNPNDYVRLIKQFWSEHTVPVRKYDFMPNWDQDRYWVGYYTTDPILKGNCKQFSGILHLHRKLLFRQYLTNQSLYNERQILLQKSDELLAVVQHHDGITATSKKHIESKFKERMKAMSLQLEQDIKKLYNIKTSNQVCQLFRNNNRCKLQLTNPMVKFTVFHEGIRKNQKIEIQLPQNNFYSVDHHQYQVFCIRQNCTLIVEAFLKPGKNQFLLKKADKSILESMNKVINMQSIRQSKSYQKNNQNFSFTDDGVFHYASSNGNFMQFSYESSENLRESRRTVWWDKFGARIDKTQYVRTGMYILFNDGQLRKLTNKIQQVYAGASSTSIRIYIKFEKNMDFQFTINILQPDIVDIKSLFTPPDRGLRDYYLRVKSNVQQTKEFYHDSNGFLVAKRILNTRPDYNFEHKEKDKINENTYPACSFAYIKDFNKKLAIFTDRARGVALYDGSFIINVDRLAEDDGKGVGQGYMSMDTHRYSLKVGIMNAEKDLQREWQRSYDQSLLGFWQAAQTQSIESSIERSQNHQNYLKYTIHFLNKNQVAVRIHNLAQFSSLSIKKTQNSLILPDLNMTINPKDIKMAYANGLLMTNKMKWIQHEVTIASLLEKDSSESFVLGPLQIRTFRINMKEAITDKHIKIKQLQDDVKMQNPKQLHVPGIIKGIPRRRCF